MTANADITGTVLYDSVVMSEQFGGSEVAVFVQDLYFLSNDPSDVVLAAFDLLLEPTAQIDYDHTPFAYGGNPGNIGGISDTESVRRVDWFVTIGGFGSDASTRLRVPRAGGDTQFDPNFGGPEPAYPDATAGRSSDDFHTWGPRGILRSTNPESPGAGSRASEHRTNPCPS
ncbi:MAG: hypothetical protein CBD91_08165 [Phycisphaeraceae bacterium TMED231]|nr:MAG: hypothetical protein CBD91_08165 [Phycisphaeraceae bacterium TMED231]